MHPLLSVCFPEPLNLFLRIFCILDSRSCQSLSFQLSLNSDTVTDTLHDVAFVSCLWTVNRQIITKK